MQIGSAAALERTALFALYAYVCAVALLLCLWVWLREWRSPADDRAGGRWPAPWHLQAAFLAASLAFLWIARLPALQYAVTLNPDEAQMAANAMRIPHGGINWGNLDPTSSGPLNSLVLAWPYLLGLEVTLTTTRIAGTAAVSLVGALVFLGLRRVAALDAAMLGSVPLFIFFGATSFYDFIHYSSEHVSLVFLMLGLFGFIAGFDRARPGHFLPAAVSLGLVPYAKIQGIPLAAVIGIALLVRAVTARCPQRLAWERGALVIAAALAPSAVILLPLAATGGFHHFVNSYVLFSQDYVGSPTTVEVVVGMVKSDPLYQAVLASYGVALALSLVSAAFISRHITPAQRWTAWLTLALLLIAYVTVIFPGRPHYHYLLFLLPVGAVAAGVLLAIALGSPGTGYRLRSAALAVVFLACVLLMFPAAAAIRRHPAFAANGAFLDGLTFSSPRVLEWLRPTDGDSLVVWGWMPQWYLSAGLTPATRETHTYNQIRSSRLRDYYRERFMVDFSESHPDFVLDAVAPRSFGFNNPKTESVHIFPELASVLASRFVNVSRPEQADDCPRLYVRRSRLRALEAASVRIARITASAEYMGRPERFGPDRLDDDSVLESCVDYWLLPDATLGSAILEFRRIDRVASIAVLNTRNGSLGDRESGSVRLSVLRDGTVVHAHELRLNRHPSWTTYRLPEAVERADAVRIDVRFFRGRGGGLNEVKIYRQ